MNIKEYIKAKYRNETTRALAIYEAKAFGVPYPLGQGWYELNCAIEITDEMFDELVPKMKHIATYSNNGKKVAAAIAGLLALGEPAPENKPLETMQRKNSQTSKKRKKRNKLERQITQARNALNNANKHLKPPVPVKMRGPTEQSVKAFIQNHSTVDPASDDFLRTFEWKATRMMALKKYKPVCMCCGDSPKSGAVLNVDHIKPRRIFPQLALDVDNLQILCSVCNAGKGSWDMTDWRSPASVAA